jgi:hypothetical protein
MSHRTAETVPLRGFLTFESEWVPALDQPLKDARGED